MTCLVKICGVTNLEDAQAAIKERADLLGFIFVAKTPRHISTEAARMIIESLPETTKTVGVFQNEEVDKVNSIASQLKLDYVQLHGQESIEYCKQVTSPIIKVLELNGDDLDREQFASECAKYSDVAEFILVDRPKKAAQTGADWLRSTVEFLKVNKSLKTPLLLAGGLNCDNIHYVIDELSPYGIDCASGVEASPGIKDHNKLKQFMTEIKGELVS
jgi:phosphoribosylanthranilate isomerase